MSRRGKDYHYPLRLPSKDAEAVAGVCRESHVSFNQVVTLCVRKALPEVGEALSAQGGRITNVDPLPAKVLKRLYGHADDDADSIRLFMAAQAKAVEE
jgi:hypothetical protein